jgi:hypothetical protein
MVNRLTSPYARESDSNNRKLLKLAGDEADDMAATIADIKAAHSINTATNKSLEILGSILQTPRTTDETDAHYRARIKTMWQRYVGSSTIQDIKNITAAMLNVNPQRVQVMEDFSTSYADFDVWLWVTDLVAAGVTVGELQTLLGVVKGAGVEVNTFQTGTFTCRGAGDSNDATKGYNNIANGFPGSGTWAGIL